MIGYIEFSGYFEDRRPASNMDPYVVTSMIAETTILWKLWDNKEDNHWWEVRWLLSLNSKSYDNNVLLLFRIYVVLLLITDLNRLKLRLKYFICTGEIVLKSDDFTILNETYMYFIAEQSFSCLLTR